MKYSVIIPAYKCESTLEATVDSIQRCGLPDFEILLVDDGSPDRTPALCDQLAAKYENVRCIHQPNGGVSSARNRGLTEAKGDYVWFFDSDDLVDPGSMESAVQIIEEHAPDMLIFGMSFDYYHKNRLYQRLEFCYDAEKEMTPGDVDAAFMELYRNNSLTSSCNKLFRRAVLTDHDIRYDPSLFILEDLYLVLQVLSCCKTVYTLPQVIYRYIQDSGTDSNHAGNRLARVKDLAEYLKPFETVLSGHPDILTGLFYMLLRQKLSVQTADEMEMTAKDNCNNEYTQGRYAMYAGENDRKLIMQLQSRNWDELLQQRNRSNIRQKMVGIIKKNPAYAFFRGAKPKRIK